MNGQFLVSAFNKPVSNLNDAIIVSLNSSESKLFKYPKSLAISKEAQLPYQRNSPLQKKWLARIVNSIDHPYKYTAVL